MDLRQQAKRTGLLGLALLVVAGGWWPGTLLDWLVTLAATTVVPWGLALVGGTESKIWRAAVGLAPLGAVGGALTWLAPAGSAKAITGVAMHAVVTALVALHGLERLRARGLSPIDELAIDVGLLLLPTGAVWWIASRAGVQLLGFQEPIVELTAAHFHYAGFAAPLVIGGVGRIVLAPKGPAHLTYRLGALVVCAGVPLTAIGIATSRALERPAAVTLALGVVIAASQIAVRAPMRERERARVAPLMLIVSGATLLVTMALATLYALTGAAAHYGAGSRLIPIERMVQFHGAPERGALCHARARRAARRGSTAARARMIGVWSPRGPSSPMRSRPSVPTRRCVTRRPTRCRSSSRASSRAIAGGVTRSSATARATKPS